MRPRHLSSWLAPAALCFLFPLFTSTKLWRDWHHGQSSGQKGKERWFLSFFLSLCHERRGSLQTLEGERTRVRVRDLVDSVWARPLLMWSFAAELFKRLSPRPSWTTLPLNPLIWSTSLFQFIEWWYDNEINMYHFVMQAFICDTSVLQACLWECFAVNLNFLTRIWLKTACDLNQ